VVDQDRSWHNRTSAQHKKASCKIAAVDLCAGSADLCDLWVNLAPTLNIFIEYCTRGMPAALLPHFHLDMSTPLTPLYRLKLGCPQIHTRGQEFSARRHMHTRQPTGLQYGTDIEQLKGFSDAEMVRFLFRSCSFYFYKHFQQYLRVSS
jgi:hypothetical protein